MRSVLLSLFLLAVLTSAVFQNFAALYVGFTFTPFDALDQGSNVYLLECDIRIMYHYSQRWSSCRIGNKKASKSAKGTTKGEMLSQIKLHGSSQGLDTDKYNNDSGGFILEVEGHY